MNQKVNQENEEQKMRRNERTRTGNAKRHTHTTAINECLKKGKKKKSSQAVKHITDERRFLHSSLNFVSNFQKRNKDGEKNASITGIKKYRSL